MPRQGDGSSDNERLDMSRNILHGVTKDDISLFKNSKDKGTPLPEGIHEGGAGLEGMNASGGGQGGGASSM